MKKLFLAIAALFIGISAMAAEPTHVRVNLKSGDPVIVSFDSKPEIAMTETGFTLTATGINATTFTFDKVDSIDFKNDNTPSTPGAVEAVDAEALRIVVGKDVISFFNVPEGALLRMFSVNGQQVYESVAGGETQIVKGDYPRGVYVIVVGDKSFKVAF